MNYSFLFFLAYLIVLSRGLMEIFFDKKIAFILQALIWFLFILYLHRGNDYKIKANKNIIYVNFVYYYNQVSK